MFEHRHESLLPRTLFFLRMSKHAAVAVGIVCASLGIGILGYHMIDGQSWIDSLVNASMLLGGMGPVGELHNTAGKLFASAYALFSGMVFLAAVGVLFAPVFHRFLHRFHLDGENGGNGEEP